MLRQLFTERVLRLMFGMSGKSYVLDNVCMSKMLMRRLPGAGRRSFGVTLYMLESQRTTPSHSRMLRSPKSQSLHGLLFLFIYFAQHLLQSALYPVDHASLLKVSCFSAVIGPFSIACPAVKEDFII